MPDFPQPELPLNRREFLGSSALNAAGVAAGIVGWGGVSAASRSPSERVRVAVIGLRNQGKSLAAALAGLPDVEVAALCDVDRSQFAPAASAVESMQPGQPPRFETDFRRLLDDSQIDAVIVATPDHWHAPLTILACQAGKDVYVEKPVSQSLSEGPLMLTAAREHGRIVQSGLQQRSGSHFQSAIEFVRSGRLGAVHLAKAWTGHQLKSIGSRNDALVPPGIDYDLWLGPAAKREFNPNRFHYNWRWFWEYGTGELGNWGVHLLDVARWGLDVGYPMQVAATGGKHYFHDDRQTPDTLHVNYAYPQCTITWEHRLWSPHGPEGRNAAVAFVGDRGTLIVDRGGWKVYGQHDALTAGPGELLTGHLRNFIDCVKTRRSPVCDLETGVVSSALCHLGNLAFRVGRSLEIDPNTGAIQRDSAAQVLAGREYRSPWGLSGSHRLTNAPNQCCVT
ncbi:MAG: Gfo/Idh/MocA family oxidoreductase [Planctomycetaceae bacterium]|nr:Gfo/Idh/MocA family oxidoreductase [Planctomycetaceae bacterium]